MYAFNDHSIDELDKKLKYIQDLNGSDINSKNLQHKLLIDSLFDQIY